MRKIYLFLLALCVSSVTCRMVAQYTVDSSIKDATITTTTDNRYCKGIALLSQKSSVAYGEKQTLSFNEGISSANYTTYKLYNDLTSGQAFEFKVGQTVNGSFDIYDTKGSVADKVWDGSWMGSYIYLDANNDGVFATDASELLRSSGTTYSSSNIVNSVREFRLPQSVGTYRMRFKIDWPEGSTATDPSNIDKNGGSITDANITLVRPTVTLVYDASRGAVTGGTAADALVCGVDYTFTVAPKTGYDATTVTATVGDGTVNVDVTPTDNGNGTYTIPADKFQNDMTINVTFVKHTFTAAEAAAGNCYFRLRSNYTGDGVGERYLRAAIAKVPDGNTTDRVSNNTATLFTHALEESSASYIWKLQPIAGSSSFYLTSQGYKMGDIGNGDDQTVRMSTETGSPVTVGTYSDYYTFTTKSQPNSYLHALKFGETVTTDSSYPTTSEGNYVASWATSAVASQWIIEPVEEFNITIGKGGWSTINYAFPVSLPASVVKAYAVSGETESAVSLAEVEPVDGAILLPSNTPVFLAGTQGAACTVSILLSEPAAISVTNELDGTLLPESPTGNIYGIATPSGKPTALYKMTTGTTIPCNKAYLASTQGGVAKLDLDFGGTTTGIDSLTPDPTTVDSNVLYDLNGRRVLYPTRGIYVTGSGKKIYLK